MAENPTNEQPLKNHMARTKGFLQNPVELLIGYIS